MPFAIILINVVDGIRSKIFPPSTWMFQMQILSLWLDETTTNWVQTWYLHFLNWDNLGNRDGRSEVLCTAKI